MQFADSTEGDHRIFVGALEAPGGEGYIAALVIKDLTPDDPRREVVYRDDSVACGHRWPTPQEALTYAMQRGREVLKKQRARALPA